MVPVGTDLKGLDPVFAAKIQALVKASGGRVTIKSGFRSVERQSALWNAAVAKYGSAKAARKWVAPPGKSNHNHGKAVDLGGDLALAHKLAKQFGLHAPMSHEPWHFEPVGHRGDKEAHTIAPTQPSTAAPAAPPVAADAVKAGPPTITQVFGELGQILMGGANNG